MTAQKIQKDSSWMPPTPDATGLLASRPFAPVPVQQQLSASPIQAEKEDESIDRDQDRNNADALDLQRKPQGTAIAPVSPPNPRNFAHNIANVRVHAPVTPAATPVQPKLVIQPKLTIGEPGDRYEEEADRMAEAVVQRIYAPKLDRSQPMPAVQRDMELEEDDELQRSLVVQRRSDAVSGAASPELETEIQRSRGGGQPLADSVRQPMEQAFGFDFSRVKIHADGRADQLNRSIQAKAFTTGQDVFFRQGAYDPGSRGGQELIAHELTHVVQQNSKVIRRSLNQSIQTQEESQSMQSLGRFIVGDDAITLELEQVRKSEFLNVLKQAVNQVSEEVLAEIKQTSTDCPYINYWFNYYEGRDAGHIESAIKRYAPETETAKDWKEAVSILANRVRQSFQEHVSYNSLEGIPEELPKNLHLDTDLIVQKMPEDRIQKCGFSNQTNQPINARQIILNNARIAAGGGNPTAQQVFTAMTNHMQDNNWLWVPGYGGLNVLVDTIPGQRGANCKAYANALVSLLADVGIDATIDGENGGFITTDPGFLVNTIDPTWHGNVSGTNRFAFTNHYWVVAPGGPYDPAMNTAGVDPRAAIEYRKTVNYVDGDKWEASNGINTVYMTYTGQQHNNGWGLYQLNNVQPNPWP